MKYNRITLDEGIRLSDLMKHSGISKFTKPFMKDRLRLFKNKSGILLQMKVNKSKDYIDFKFVSTPTYDPEGSKITKPKSMKLVPGNEYDQTIRILNFFKLLKTNPNIKNIKDASIDNIKEVLNSSEIKCFCDCPMFWWQGVSYYLTQEFDGSIYPNNIEPKVWNKKHNNGDGLICKHLDLIFSQMSRYNNNFASMIYKYIQKKGI
jgi:hypothetical protein